MQSDREDHSELASDKLWHTATELRRECLARLPTSLPFASQDIETLRGSGLMIEDLLEEHDCKTQRSGVTLRHTERQAIYLREPSTT